MSSFQDISNSISSEFLQSVVFLDDKAYRQTEPADIAHDFDVNLVVKAFAQSAKICSVIQPESSADIALFTEIAMKADIVVLDWRITLPEGDEEDDEADAEVDDHDGHYSKAVITNLLSSEVSQNSLKLILIYTGNSDLVGIAQDTLAALRDSNISGFEISEDDECCIFSHSCKILVRAKVNGGEDRGRHNPVLRDKAVNYVDLPDFVNEQFAQLTNGLLSIFALKALTAIRQNSFQILNVFSKKLDTAYLTNQTLLGSTEDANELLVELLGDTFISILRAKDLNTTIDHELIGKWLEHFFEEGTRKVYGKEGEETDQEFRLTSDMVLKLLSSNKNVLKKFKDVLNLGVINGSEDSKITKSQTTEKNYAKYALDLFSSLAQPTDNQGYANLCQHKNIIHGEEYVPFLTLGTVVKSSLYDDYYVCIQQRCDSVRVKEDEKRRFIFLTLNVVNSGNPFDFVTPNGTKLILNRKTYGLRTIKFNGGQRGVVEAALDGDKLVFRQAHVMTENTESFEFVFELKELYAQRIVDEYSSSISRVGLDEPEWIRLSKR